MADRIESNSRNYVAVSLQGRLGFGCKHYYAAHEQIDLSGRWFWSAFHDELTDIQSHQRGKQVVKYMQFGRDF